MGFLSRSSMLPKGVYDDRGVSVMKRARRQRSESDKLLEEDLRRIRTTAPMTPGQRATAVAGIVLLPVRSVWGLFSSFRNASA